MKKKFNAPGSKTYLNKKVLITIAGVTLVVVTTVVGYFYVLKSNQNETNSTEVSQSTEVKNMIEVFISKEVLNTGDFVETSDFEVVSYSQEDVPTDAITDVSELRGKILKNDIEQGAILQRKDLLHKMPYDEDDRFVEHNFVDGAIPTTIPAEQLIGTIVDIILFRQGAIDEIVISKATIIAKDMNKLSFHLNPIEREFLKEASTEGMFYLTAYAEKNQKASEVTYVPGYLK